MSTLLLPSCESLFEPNATTPVASTAVCFASPDVEDTRLIELDIMDDAANKSLHSKFLT